MNEAIHIDEANSQKIRQDNKKRNNKISFLRSSFILDSHNKIKKNSIKNIVTIIEKDPIFKDAFKYNEFTQENEVTKKIPRLKINCGQFEDAIIDEIANYIENQTNYDHVVFDSQKIRSALTIVCKNHSYNPLIDYLKKAHECWDKKSRIKNIFTTYLGAEDSEVNHTIAIHFFSNAVAQVFNAGRKNDEVLDLVGKQGTGKTEFFRRITPLDLYTDNFTTFNKPDDLNQFRLSFIINDDELAVSNKVSFEDVKKFASLRKETFRASYGHFPKTYLRKWSFVRTTNNLYYLRDLTGNRRFMPVLANKSNAKKSVFSITENDRKQIWGEAVALYEEDLEKQKQDKNFKGILHFTKEQEKLVAHAQLQFTGTSSIEDEIDMLINVTTFATEDFIKSSDLAHELKIDPVKDSKIMSKVSSIMVNKMNFKKKRDNGIRGFRRVSS